MSRDVWKRRVAEALRETATGGGSGKKLAEARARLQVGATLDVRSANGRPAPPRPGH